MTSFDRTIRSFIFRERIAHWNRRFVELNLGPMDLALSDCRTIWNLADKRARGLAASASAKP